MSDQQKNPLFPLGLLCATPGALEALEAAGDAPQQFLGRHASGDWGELDDFDKRQNDLAVQQGTRILSAYTLSTSVKIWIITEADRSVTTFLLPEEY